MSQISIRNLTFGYPNSSAYIYKDVNLSIDTNWRLGLIGRNGRGKTTLLKLLMGQLEYSGVIQHNTVFEYFPFDVRIGRIVVDTIAEIVPQAQEWEFREGCNDLDVDCDCLYREWATLSGGEITKLMLIALFVSQRYRDSFLLIDEPTDHLDSNARQVVARYLSSKRGFVLVSHDRAVLDQCITHILSINKTSIDIFRSNFSQWWTNKERQHAFERATNDRLNADIDRLQQSSIRMSQWANKGHRESMGRHSNNTEGLMGYKEYHRNKVAKLESQVKQMRAKQAQSIQAKQGLLKDIEHTPSLGIRYVPHTNELLIGIRDLVVELGDRVVLRLDSLDIYRGDIVLLTGKNGSGKSTLLDAINGLNQYKAISRAPQLSVSYLRQTHNIQGTIVDHADKSGVDVQLLLTILAKLGLSLTLEQDIAELSIGQRQKVALATSLATTANIYIWDEPLNYIDILSRIQLQELLCQTHPTMILVEHDHSWVSSIATRTVHLDSSTQP